MRTLFLFLALSMSASLIAQTTETLSIGSNAPATDIKMADISGNSYSLNNLKKEKGLLVVFSCNGCPFVVGSELQIMVLAWRSSIAMKPNAKRAMTSAV